MQHKSAETFNCPGRFLLSVIFNWTIVITHREIANEPAGKFAPAGKTPAGNPHESVTR